MARIKPLSEVLNGVTRFGRLTVLGEAPPRVSASGFTAKCAHVRCDCGTEKSVRAGDLKNGYAQSCGCLQKELTAARIVERTRTHGHAGSGEATPEYRTWSSLKKRCLNPKDGSYDNYGGRGITVCGRWRDSFEAFYEDMGPRPSSRHSIERVDVDGNYEPSNCRWATPTEQANNRRSNVVLTIDGESSTVAEWSRKAGVRLDRIYTRLRKGWSHRDAVFGPAGGRRYHKPPTRARIVRWQGCDMLMSEACADAGVSPSDVLYHIKRGKSAEDAIMTLIENRRRREGGSS